MKKRKKMMFIFGTRPEAIKMAPLILDMQGHQAFKPIVVSTGQHDEMLHQVMRAFRLKLDYDLEIMRKNQTLSQIISFAIKGLSKIIEKEKPDMILVQGDTTTALAAALSAFYQKVPLAHVEAGLRTFDKWRPYPEEINRQLITRLADLHFAPTRTAFNHLLRERINKDELFITGNTVIDALMRICNKKSRPNKFPFKLQPDKKIILVTAHRRENFGRPMQEICRALRKLQAEFSGSLQIVIPMHKNPKVRDTIKRLLGQLPGVDLIEPLSYEVFAQLIKLSYLILTDSGGIQEEAPSLGKPVLVLREKTERPEAVFAKTVKLVGVQGENIYREARILLSNKKEYNKMARAVNPYGDGRASGRIIQILMRYFGLSEVRPKNFNA